MPNVDYQLPSDKDIKVKPISAQDGNKCKGAQYLMVRDIYTWKHTQLRGALKEASSSTVQCIVIYTITFMAKWYHFTSHCSKSDVKKASLVYKSKVLYVDNQKYQKPMQVQLIL